MWLAEQMPSVNSFLDDSLDPFVRGFLHSPDTVNGDAVILTHGAGSNCNAPLLIALSETFAEKGYLVLRCDLPFRQKKPTGPPFGHAEKDRAGLRNAIAVVRKLVTGQVFLGGHSYGGRQASILCAAEAGLVSRRLLLLSYPLHPPRQPEQLRTQHFPDLHIPSLFVHGTRDPFGSIEEMTEALRLIPAKTELMVIEGAGHDLGFKGKMRAEEIPGRVVAAFQRMRV
jgi:predicted alpha/beta-hydrolase family hydrolase